MKTRKASLIAATLTAMLAFGGCGGSVTSPDNSAPGMLTVYFPNGSEFVSTVATVQDVSSDYIVTAQQNISGSQPDLITLTIPKETITPYTVQALPDGAVVTYDEYYTGDEFRADPTQGSCSITVTQIDPTFEGYFSARTVYNDTVLDLTNGSFNAGYQ